jgi:organic radical activating enzyme
VSIVVSPKTAHVHANVRLYAEAWKYIVSAGTLIDDATGYPSSSTQERGRVMKLGHPDDPGTPVYMQPMDHGAQHPDENAAAVARCVELCLLYGHVLSLQQHKIVGLP